MFYKYMYANIYIYIYIYITCPGFEPCKLALFWHFGTPFVYKEMFVIGGLDSKIIQAIKVQDPDFKPSFIPWACKPNTEHTVGTAMSGGTGEQARTLAFTMLRGTLDLFRFELTQEGIYHDKMKAEEGEWDGDCKELARKTREQQHDLRVLAVAAEMEVLGDLSRVIPPTPTENSKGSPRTPLVAWPEFLQGQSSYEEHVVKHRVLARPVFLRGAFG